MDSQAESFYLFAVLNKILGLLCYSLIFNDVPPNTLVLKKYNNNLLKIRYFQNT